jgi:ATPase subunit of ABC transporter with duplicated ATPase domains
MANVSIREIHKHYADFHAVKGVSLEIKDKEFVVLVGPSGCGKTTTLRMVAGLEAITEGQILIGPQVVNELPPMDRDIAMVFQNYALYPHMSVRQHGLRMKYASSTGGSEARQQRRRYPRHQGSSTANRGAVGWSASARSSGAPSSAIRRCSCSMSAINLDAFCACGRVEIRNCTSGWPPRRLRHPRPGRGDDAGRPRRRMRTG